MILSRTVNLLTVLPIPPASSSPHRPYPGRTRWIQHRHRRVIDVGRSTDFIEIT